MDATNIEDIRKVLREKIDSTPEKMQRFCDTKPGGYAEHDKFLGISTPALRKTAKDFSDLQTNVLQDLLDSQYNEERLFALIILVERFKCSTQEERNIICQFYLQNMDRINNWNLVDVSAHHILGSYSWYEGTEHIFALARSQNMWGRRIAIVATKYFLRWKHFEDIFAVSEILFDDKEDLIHKACGWILREVGKKSIDALEDFLQKKCTKMPKTTLRYAIENMTKTRRQYWLNKARGNPLPLSRRSDDVPRK